MVWQREATAFGFSVRHRQNVFHNPMLTVVARLRADKEIFREPILGGLRQIA